MKGTEANIMRENKNILYLIIAALTAVFIGSILSHYSHYKPSVGENKTIIRYDTVCRTIFKVIEKPKVVNKAIIKYDTIYQNRDTSIVLPVTRRYHKDTVFFTENDTMIVETTIVGINPSLERINMLLKKRQIEKTIENTIIKQKKPTFKDRLFIAPTVGVGYGLFNKKPDLYIGVSAGIKF